VVLLVLLLCRSCGLLCSRCRSRNLRGYALNLRGFSLRGFTNISRLRLFSLRSFGLFGELLSVLLRLNRELYANWNISETVVVRVLLLNRLLESEREFERKIGLTLVSVASLRSSLPSNGMAQGPGMVTSSENLMTKPEPTKRVLSLVLSSFGIRPIGGTPKGDVTWSLRAWIHSVSVNRVSGMASLFNSQTTGSIRPNFWTDHANGL
jgi:hypothetical protein